MSTRVLGLFTIMMLFVLQAVFIISEKEYDGNQNVAFENAQLKKQISQQKAKTEVAYYELDSYKQKVAMALPKNMPQQKYQMRNIASLVQDNQNSLTGMTLDLRFKQIKKTFLNKNYEKASIELEQFINDYPESAHLVEAYYLYISSLHSLSQYEKCLKAINVLVDQYPESEITGLSLLIMADIFEKQERNDEAKEIYRTIIHNFAFPELKQRAQERLSEIDI